MNPTNFAGSSVTKDLEKIVEELQKVFEVIHVADADHVELAEFQLKGVAWIWFDQWNKSRVERAQNLSWIVFESAFLGRFFPRELREEKVIEFLTLK